MAIYAGLAAAAGSVIGDIFNSQGTQQTNAANEQINTDNINAAMARQTQAQSYNADQAQIGRDFAAQQQANAQNFSAQQVAQQEQFQTNMFNTSMAYDTEMSDTAMQRRVADLKAAGINPLLAVSQGGASTPTVNPMSGSSASGSPVSGPTASSGTAGQGTGIAMQNPNAAFGNLGGQLASAMTASQTGAQIDLLKAQTDKLNQESGNEIPANVQYLQAMTGLNNQNANVAALNAQQIAAKLKYDAGDSGNYALDWTKNWATTGAATTNTDILRATKDSLISAQQSDATAKALGLQELRNLNQVQQGKFGEVLAYLNAILKPVGSAAQAAGAIAP